MPIIPLEQPCKGEAGACQIPPSCSGSRKRNNSPPGFPVGRMVWVPAGELGSIFCAASDVLCDLRQVTVPQFSICTMGITAMPYLTGALVRRNLFNTVRGSDKMVTRAV